MEWPFRNTHMRYCGILPAFRIAQAQFIKPAGAMCPLASYYHFEIGTHRVSIPVSLVHDAGAAIVRAQEIAIAENWGA